MTKASATRTHQENIVAIPLLTVLLTALCVAANVVVAQGYPYKTIRIIVPFTPGAFNDALGRTIAQKFSDSGFGTAIVDNRPGAASTLGAEIAAKSPGDGYTLLIVVVPFAANQTLYTRLPYDTLRDLTPVIYAGASANILAVHPSVPVTTVQDLIKLAKASPGLLTYASAGSGTSPHMAMELLKLLTGVNMLHIPYKGGTPAIRDLIGGHVMMYCENLPNLLPHAKAGRLRAIAVTTTSRIKQAPEILTIAETVPGYEVVVWFGVVAPAAAPRDVIVKLNAEISKTLTLPDVRERFLNGAVDPVGGSPEHFGAHLKSEVTKWAKVVKATGARID
jgi:tripartite-type tricarboxylate transporter receptor subunit TctC